MENYGYHMYELENLFGPLISNIYKLGQRLIFFTGNNFGFINEL